MFGGQQNNSGTNAFSGFSANNNTNSNTSSQQGGTSVFGASKSAESNAFGASNSTSKPLFSSGAQQQSSSTPAFGAPKSSSPFGNASTNQPNAFGSAFGAAPKTGDYLEPTQLTQQLNQVQYLDKRKMMLLPVLLERPVLDYLELIPLLTISRLALLLVLLHRPPPMKRQKNPNQLALSVPNQQTVQQVQAQQGYLLVLKTKQIVQLAVEAYLGPRKINLQHQREDYSALQQQVRMPNQQMIPPQVVN